MAPKKGQGDHKLKLLKMSFYDLLDFIFSQKKVDYILKHFFCQKRFFLQNGRGSPGR